MIYAANTVTYNLANDDENFNKVMASDSLEWPVMQMLKQEDWIWNLGKKVIKVCELHIGWFAA